MDQSKQDELVMYILVNEDLNMSAGKIAGQVGHAISKYANGIICNLACGDKTVFAKWSKWMPIQKKIILKAPQLLLEKLEEGYWGIRDLGLTEIDANSLTAICLGIDTREGFYERMPKLKRLRLL